MDGTRSGEWQRGVLATCALAVLADGEAHGYAIAQRLQAAGIGPVRGGALYPVLNRLEQDGLLVSTWQEGAGGPGRKVFRLTASGRGARSRSGTAGPPSPPPSPGSSACGSRCPRSSATRGRREHRTW